MKRTFTLLTLLFSFLAFSQTCGFDEVQGNLEKQFPEIRQNREAAELKLLNMNVRAYLDKMGATFKGAKYTGEIFEIPVVLHVITSNASSNNQFALSDTQLTKWIDDCNKMYAATYGNGFFPEGPGNLDGNVIPIKLVLAKRSPSCAATSGIIRYNGSTIPGYDDYGVKSSGSGGATQAQIRALAPHWPENSFFNIYVVTTFDANKTTYGLMGWCGLPTNPDSSYESYMKAAVVTNPNSTTLAHEFGHGMGLMHTFNGASGTSCPQNNNCQTDNDYVCDTEPGASLLGASPFPEMSDINSCTGVNYDGVQYNMMNYTARPRKFTAGQRERALAVFLQYRGTLTKSLGGTEIDAQNGPTLAAATCVPPGIRTIGNFGMGPRRVELGDIDNASEPVRTSNPAYYIDYTKLSCLNKSFSTDISDVAESSLKVSFGTNPQFVKAYIDFNNNGSFESNELIGKSETQVPITASPFVIKFTPPADAVKNVPLRMRVIVDDEDLGACDQLAYGQAEDYAVTLRNPLGTKEFNNDKKGQLVFVKNENKLQLFSPEKSGFGNYEIYDMNGQVLQKGKAQKEINLKRQLPKGVYIIKYENNSQKFIN